MCTTAGYKSPPTGPPYHSCSRPAPHLQISRQPPTYRLSPSQLASPPPTDPPYHCRRNRCATHNHHFTQAYPQPCHLPHLRTVPTHAHRCPPPLTCGPSPHTHPAAPPPPHTPLPPSPPPLTRKHLNLGQWLAAACALAGCCGVLVDEQADPATPVADGAAAQEGSTPIQRPAILIATAVRWRQHGTQAQERVSEVAPI